MTTYRFDQCINCGEELDDDRHSDGMCSAECERENKRPPANPNIVDRDAALAREENNGWF